MLVFSVASCDMLKTREDIQKENEEKQLKEQVSSIQKGKADSEVRYNDLQNDLRNISGRVDTLDHNQQVGAQSNKADIEALKKLLEAQNDKIKLIEQHIDATETRLTAAIQAAANAAPTPLPATAGGGAGGKDSAKDASKDGGLFGDAENFFSKKDFKHAIVKYQAYRDKNPKGTKNAEATYKIGVCFFELGSKKEAKEFYQETIDSFPGTSSAKKAKLRLSQLK